MYLDEKLSKSNAMFSRLFFQNCHFVLLFVQIVFLFLWTHFYNLHFSWKLFLFIFSNVVGKRNVSSVCGCNWFHLRLYNKEKTIVEISKFARKRIEQSVQ